MRIALVADMYGEENNGTTITARRLVDSMRAKGHEVTVISPYQTDKEGYITVPKRTFPAFTHYIESNGVSFAAVDEDKLREGIEGRDVVHFLLPFRLCKAGLKIARELKVPYTSAFHCQPENITSHIFMEKLTLPNKMLYKSFRNKFYKYNQFIHCPSAFIAGQLDKNGYKAEKRVISNGVIPTFKKQPSDKPEEFKDKICVLFIGRYSGEKRHDLLIKAVKKSKYADKIQLIFAGNGPRKKKLTKMGAKLKNPPYMSLFSKEDLCRVINYCDVYVHPSDVEIEAISCIEAFTCGLVPVISDSKKTATKQFALTERNLFRHGNPKDLASKIDWLIDHPEEKAKLSEQYLEYAKQYSIESCMDKMEQMFFDAIAYYKDYYSKN